LKGLRYWDLSRSANEPVLGAATGEYSRDFRGGTLSQASPFLPFNPNRSSALVTFLRIAPSRTEDVGGDAWGLMAATASSHGSLSDDSTAGHLLPSDECVLPVDDGIAAHLNRRKCADGSVGAGL
jgi:hypothetical protein